MEFIFSHNSKRLSYVSPWCSTTTSNMSRLEHVTMKGEASHCLLSHSLGNTLQKERVKYMYMYTYYISSSVQWKCTAYAIVTERSVPPIQFLPIIGQRICWHHCNNNLQLVNKCTNLNKSYKQVAGLPFTNLIPTLCHLIASGSNSFVGGRLLFLFLPSSSEPRSTPLFRV